MKTKWRIKQCCNDIVEHGNIYESFVDDMGPHIEYEKEYARFNVRDGDGYYALQDIKYCPYCGEKLARQIE